MSISISLVQDWPSVKISCVFIRLLGLKILNDVCFTLDTAVQHIELNCVWCDGCPFSRPIFDCVDLNCSPHRHCLFCSKRQCHHQDKLPLCMGMAIFVHIVCLFKQFDVNLDPAQICLESETSARHLNPTERPSDDSLCCRMDHASNLMNLMCLSNL